MNFSARKKRNIIITLALSVMVSLCFFGFALSSTTVKAESFTGLSGTPHNSVQLVAATDYGINFNSADRLISASDKSGFEKDAYEYNNICLEYGGTQGSLGTSYIRSGGPVGTMGITQADFTYNVKAPVGTTFTYLDFKVTGRVDHYNMGDGQPFYDQHGTGTATTCDACYMKVYVSTTADFTNAPSKDYPASTAGFLARKMDLIEINPAIGNTEECFVRIEISGSRDWVMVEAVNFSTNDPNPSNEITIGNGSKEISFAVGEENANNWGQLTEIYKSSGLNYSQVAADHICIASSGSDGYVVYKLVSSEIGKSFASLSVSCFGRVFHYNHPTGCSSNCRMEIWVSDNPLFTGIKTAMAYKVLANDDGNSSARTVDISEYASAIEPDISDNAKHEVYVKILLNGVGDWVSLEKLTFIATEKYTGYSNVNINIEDVSGNIVFDKNAEVPFKNYTISNAVSTAPTVSMTVLGPDGNNVDFEGESFIPTALGEYKVTYTVDDEGRLYTNTYSVFCVDDSAQSGLNKDDYIVERKDEDEGYAFVYRDNTVFNTKTNYAIADNTDFLTVDGNGTAFTRSDFVTEEAYLAALKSAKVSLKATDENVGKKAVASMLLPIENVSKTTTLLDITKFEQGFRFVVAFTSKAGIPDFSTMTDNGIYFVFTKAGTKMIINGFFTGEDKDGNRVVGGPMGAQYMTFSNGTIGLCVSRQILTDANGSRDIINVYWNGVQACYNANIYKPSSFVGSNGEMYVSFCNENSASGTVLIGGVYEGSSGVPVLSWADDYFDEDNLLIEDQSKHNYVFNSTLSEMTEYVYVDAEFELPNLEFFDTKDGVLKLSTVITDPNGNEVEVLEKQVEKTYKKLDDNGVVIEVTENVNIKYINIEYAGRYSLTYTATNYSASEITDIRSFDAIYKDGAYEMSFDEYILPYGRVGRAVYIPSAQVQLVDGDYREDPTLTPDVKVKITAPSGEIEYVKPGSFYPTFEKGKYSILYTVESLESGLSIVSKEFFWIQVKDDVDEESSYKDALDASNWVSYDMVTLVGMVGAAVRTEEQDDLVNSALSSEPHVEETENGLLLYEAAYCKLPFKLYEENDENHNGIELSIDISRLRDKTEKDAWVCFGFSSKPGPGSFSHVMTPGSVYIMFYREGNEYFYTAMYVRSDGKQGGLFTYSLGAQNVLTFGIDKITDSPSKTDNVNFYFNHTVTSAGTETQIPYSELVDNEGFIYLNYWGQGSGDDPRTFKAVEIKSISVCDQSAPVFNFEGGEASLPKTFSKGEKVKLPAITVSDNLDKEFNYQIALVAPDGKLIDYTKEFEVDQDGSYYLILKAMDNAGNYTNKHIVFEVVSGGCGSSFSADTLLSVAIILSAASLACVVRTVKKKFEK